MQTIRCIPQFRCGIYSSTSKFCSNKITKNQNQNLNWKISRFDVDWFLSMMELYSLTRGWPSRDPIQIITIECLHDNIGSFSSLVSYSSLNVWNGIKKKNYKEINNCEIVVVRNNISKVIIVIENTVGNLSRICVVACGRITDYENKSTSIDIYIYLWTGGSG